MKRLFTISLALLVGCSSPRAPDVAGTVLQVQEVTVKEVESGSKWGGGNAGARAAGVLIILAAAGTMAVADSVSGPPADEKAWEYTLQLQNGEIKNLLQKKEGWWASDPLKVGQPFLLRQSSGNPAKMQCVEPGKLTRDKIAVLIMRNCSFAKK